MRRTICAAVLAVLAAASLAIVAPGTAMASTARTASTTVRAGQSIQQAIDRAKPGSIVAISAGIYRENLLITKPLTLRGIGHVVLQPGATIAQNLCTEDEDGSPESDRPNNVGICILGQFGTATADDGAPPALLKAVTDVTIQNLRITGFSGQGLIAFGSDNLQVANVEVDHSADVGVFSKAGTRSAFVSDRVHDNGGAGIRVSDSSGFTITRTTSYRNHDGVLILDSVQGSITHAVLAGNCAGLAVIDTADGVATGDITVRENAVVANSRYCPAGEAPSESGVGVGLLGTTAMVVMDNLIADNVGHPDPNTGERAQFGGGALLLLDATDLTGGAAPTQTRVTGNLFAHNEPADVVTDGTGSGNTFAHNRCRESTPASICD